MPTARRLLATGYAAFRRANAMELVFVGRLLSVFGGSGMKIRQQQIGRPLAIAAAVAVISAAAFWIFEFDSSKDQQAPDHSAITATAQSAGAKVIPTQPKLSVEPTPPGPKPAPLESSTSEN